MSKSVPNVIIFVVEQVDEVPSHDAGLVVEEKSKSASRQLLRMEVFQFECIFFDVTYMFSYLF